jgi:hypothetical protein
MIKWPLVERATESSHGPIGRGGNCAAGNKNSKFCRGCVFLDCVLVGNPLLRLPSHTSLLTGQAVAESRSATSQSRTGKQYGHVTAGAASWKWPAMRWSGSCADAAKCRYCGASTKDETPESKHQPQPNDPGTTANGAMPETA